MKNCQFCAEEIQNNAIKCKHCGESQVKPQQSKQPKKSENSIPEEVLKNANLWNCSKIKDPKKYGGWSKAMLWWGILGVIGLIIGIIGLMNDKGSIVKNAQAKQLIVFSLLWAFVGISLTM
tara:strand:- start:202 stop:564 length:363 start_codon:yes stop_codon:yes gene_type:complete